jgi:hypothetical protein
MERGKDCRPGDKVKFLHEKGEGTVVRNTKEYVYVDNGDGFELPFMHKDLIIMEKAPLTKDVPKESQSVFSESEPEIYQTVKKPISKKGVDMGKGIYLAFSPVNQDIMLVGDIHLYLINYTKLSGFYVLHTDNNEMMYSGKIDSASALLLDTIERKDTSAFRRSVFQFLFLESSQRGIVAPFSTISELKPERFIKEELYAFNPVLSKYAITTLFMRFDEIQYISGIAGKDSRLAETQVSHSKVIENEGLIGKYKTAPKEAEVDLHIETLVSNPQSMDDTMKLIKQLDAFKQCLDSAVELGYRKVIFIHGVGVGVLKMEIHKVLRTYENLTFRDAPIARYGIGATEVLIDQAK